jgi:hypothetical protein
VFERARAWLKSCHARLHDTVQTTTTCAWSIKKIFLCAQGGLGVRGLVY